MEIKKEHKRLLKSLGLKDKDFERFDGENVTYEYDEHKGVRLYDPDYVTSYNEYISVDGWSSWSSEEDTFMSDIVKGAREKAEARGKKSAEPTQEELEDSLRAKFDGKTGNDKQ